MSSIFPLTWYGPFSFNSVSTSPYAEMPGIYLWSIPFRHGFLVYYVGKADRSIGQRLREEKVRFHAGTENLPNYEQFSQGKPFADLDYKPKSAKTPSSAYYSDPYKIRACADKLFDLLKVFIAPINDPTIKISIAEDRTVWDLWDRGGRCDNFLGCHVYKHGKTKPTLSILHSCPTATLWGLTKELME